jgi:glutamate racemase
VRIGVFDSGVGGLTVTKSLLDSSYFSEIIYFGDTARVPYGSKDKNVIIRYALEAVEFFKNFDIKLLVVACNTVSAFALQQMRDEADFEIIGVIDSGVEALLKRDFHTDHQVLVIGTEATIGSQSYQNLLANNGYNSVEAIPTPLLVPIVEEGVRGAVLRETLNLYFGELHRPDSIILGCTHFPLISDEIADYFGESPELIHSGDAIIEHLQKVYTFTEKFETDIKIFASENPKNLRAFAKKWLYE